MLKIQGHAKKLADSNFWLVKEVVLPNIMTINGHEVSSVVCKFPKGNPNNIELNIRNYKKCARCQLPTLSFAEHGFFENQECLVVEDLKTRPGKLYISPNTRQDCLFSESNEAVLTKHKLENISNLEDLLSLFQQDARRASCGRLTLSDDAIFFGINKETNLISDYLFADFDNIEESNDYSSPHHQTYEMLQALYQFATEYIQESPKKEKLLERITTFAKSLL